MKTARQVLAVAATLAALASLLGHLFSPVLGTPPAADMVALLAAQDASADRWAAVWLSSLPSTLAGTLLLLISASAVFRARAGLVPTSVVVGEISAAVAVFAVINIPPPGLLFSVYVYVFTGAWAIPFLLLSAGSERVAVFVFRVGAPYFPCLVTGAFAFAAGVAGGAAGAVIESRSGTLAPGRTTTR